MWMAGDNAASSQEMRDMARAALDALEAAEPARKPSADATWWAAQQPGENLRSRVEARDVLAQEFGLDTASAAHVLRRAYGHTEASFSYGNVPGSQLGYVRYDRERGTYLVESSRDDR
jgi:hypothetical protein